MAASLMGALTTTSYAAKHRKIIGNTWSQNRYTFEEAIERYKGLDFDGIEAFPGQEVSKNLPGARMGPELTKEQRDYVKKLLKDANMKLVSFGVTGTGNNPAYAEQLCEFAKDMGIERILTEDSLYMWPIWEEIAAKYGVTMCVHNHATDNGNQYVDTELVKKYLKNYKHVKSGADVGHMGRSGMDPAKSLKTLKGKIAQLHFKDISKFGDIGAYCVPLGQGGNMVKEMLQELDKQGYDGPFVLEYEAEWDNNIESIKECIEFLRKN